MRSVNIHHVIDWRSTYCLNCEYEDLGTTKNCDPQVHKHLLYRLVLQILSCNQQHLGVSLEEGLWIHRKFKTNIQAGSVNTAAKICLHLFVVLRKVQYIVRKS